MFEKRSNGCDEHIAENSRSFAAVVLAAGAGTRMKSALPKVAHVAAGRPLVRWVVDAARSAGAEPIVTVVGYGREVVEPLVSNTVCVYQQAQRGTADAVSSAASALRDYCGSVVVLSGDSPLIRPETLVRLAEMREKRNAAVVVLTMVPDNPFGYGRIIRNGDGEVLRIVEQRDATPEEAAVGECNSGMYCFEARALFDALSRVRNDNAQGEFYLTDVVEICRAAGKRVYALQVEDSRECLGVNTPEQLHEVEGILQSR